MGSGPALNPREEPAAIQAALNGDRPKVLLPGDNRPMSEVAARTRKAPGRAGFTSTTGEIVALDGNVLRPVDAQTFRTLAEESVVCCRQRTSGHSTVQVDVSHDGG